jgi:acyl carrier protein
MTNRHKVYEIISETLGVSTNSIDDDTTPADIESWDSFNALMLVSELEEKFSLSFTIEEVTGVRKVGDIIRVLGSHGIEFEDK